MADQGTEQATPLRKKKARDRGDNVRSRELLSAMAMLGGVAVLGAISQRFIASFGAVYAESLHMALVSIGRSETQNAQQLLLVAATRFFVPALIPVGLVMAVSFCGALVSGLAQGGGLNFHPDAIGFKFNRLNPVTNLGNIFSLRSVTRMMKSLVPAVVMLALGWSAVKKLMLESPVMSLLRLPAMFTTAYALTLDAAWIMLAWSALDYAVEWRSWNQRLKMSKQEIREEIRDSIGNPQIKARVRQTQRAMRRRRMKADVSRASVVITNPTHYAVALEFSFETMSAPTVLTKGRDLHAAEIREEARWAGVPIIENPPLARSLYKLVEPGNSIPFELYAAVAGILAYLYRQKVEERLRHDRRAKEAEERNPSTAPMPSRTDKAISMTPNFGGGI